MVHGGCSGLFHISIRENFLIGLYLQNSFSARGRDAYFSIVSLHVLMIVNMINYIDLAGIKKLPDNRSCCP